MINLLHTPQKSLKVPSRTSSGLLGKISPSTGYCGLWDEYNIGLASIGWKHKSEISKFPLMDGALRRKFSIVVHGGAPVKSDNMNDVNNHANHPERSLSNPSASTIVSSSPGENAAECAILVEWSPEDQENPRSWSSAKRWFITVFCAILTLNVTIASSGPSTATGAIVEEFNVSVEVATLVTSLFLCGYVAGPILWAPLSEMIGRRPVFIGTTAAYTIFQLGIALKQTNLPTILTFRFLTGLFASAPVTNSAGVIADVWEVARRPEAVSLFMASVFLGPVIGPVIGSFLVESELGYRWMFWVMMIGSGITGVAAYFCLPETYSPILLVRKAKTLRKTNPRIKIYATHENTDNSLKSLIQRTFLRPLEMLVKEPILLLVTLYLAVIYGLLYGLFEAFPIIWSEIRGFSQWQTSLIFIGVGIGDIFGAFFNIYLSRPMTKAIKRGDNPPCEQNLRGAMASGPFLVVGIFLLGWTGAYASIVWWVPAISTIFLGMAFTMLFIAFSSYLVDVYADYAASAMAANTIVRSAVGAAFPLFTPKMLHGMGTQWACTMIGCLALLLFPIPFIFYWFGARIRLFSKFAPTSGNAEVKNIITPIESQKGIVILNHK